MTDRNKELVPDSWSLVREEALTTGLCSGGWCPDTLNTENSVTKGTDAALPLPEKLSRAYLTSVRWVESSAWSDCSQTAVLV